MTQNIVKLAVGVDSIEGLYLNQARRLFNYKGVKATNAWTRRRPRDHEAIVTGGSIYWVIRNHILVRQYILGFEPQTYDDGTEGWVIVLDANLTQTMAAPRKAFQGWRYLAPGQAPPDRGCYIYSERDEDASPEVEGVLRGIGLL